MTQDERGEGCRAGSGSLVGCERNIPGQCSWSSVQEADAVGDEVREHVRHGVEENACPPQMGPWTSFCAWWKCMEVSEGKAATAGLKS